MRITDKRNEKLFGRVDVYDRNGQLKKVALNCRAFMMLCLKVTGENNWCSGEDQAGFGCTRELGHTGPHIAHTYSNHKGIATDMFSLGKVRVFPISVWS